MMYMHVCVCVACVRAVRVREWPWAGESGLPLQMRIGPGLRAEMMAGTPTITSASDAHPERKIHRRNSC